MAFNKLVNHDMLQSLWSK